MNTFKAGSEDDGGFNFHELRTMSMDEDPFHTEIMGWGNSRDVVKFEYNIKFIEIYRNSFKFIKKKAFYLFFFCSIILLSSYSKLFKTTTFHVAPVETR